METFKKVISSFLAVTLTLFSLPGASVITYAETADTPTEAVNTELPRFEAPVLEVANNNTAIATPVATWTAIPGASRYRVNIESSVYFTADTSYDLSFLESGKSYRVYVQADEDMTHRCSQMSNTVTVVNKCATSLKAPSLSAVALDSTNLKVTVGSVPGDCEYQLQMSNNSAFKDATTTTVTSGSSIMSGFEANTNYYFRVRAIASNASYLSSEWSPTASAQTLIAPIETPYLTFTPLSNDLRPEEWVIYNAIKNGDFAVSGDDDSTTKTATITGLTPNTTYYIRIYAVDSTGNYANSAYSEVKTVKTAQKLTAPTVTATANKNMSISVSLTSVANASGYTIEASTSSSFTSPITVTSTTTSATFPDLTEGAKYYIRAKATYPDQAVYTNSEWSSSVSATLPTKLATPTVTISDYGLTNITATWGAIANASSYSVEIANNASFTDATVQSVTATSYNFTELTQGITYYVRVKAVATSASYADSLYSATVNKTTLTKLATPVLTFTPLSTSSVFIDFNKPTGWDHLIIEYADNAEFDDMHTVQIDSSTLTDGVYAGQTFTGLTEGTTFYFRAKFTTDNTALYVDSEKSRIVYCETAGTLSAPTFELTPVNDTSVKVSVDNMFAAGKYEIEVTPEGGTATKILTTRLDTVIPNLTSNTTYSIRVKAISNSSKFMDSPYSAAQTVTTLTKTTAPATLELELTTPTSVTSTVSTISGVTTYVTEIATDSTFADNTAYTGSNVHTFLALQPGTTYYLRAKALAPSATFVDSNYTSVYTITTPPDLNAPLVSAVATAMDKLSVTLGSVTDSAGYTIEIADNSYFNNSRTIDTTSLTNTIDSLEEGTTYYIRAKSLYSDVTGAYSNWSSVVTAKTWYRLDTPVITVEALGPTEISVITSATNAGGYDIEISTSSTFASADTVHATAMRTTISGLVTDTTYYVRAKAIATATGTVNSEFCEASTVKTPLKLTAPSLSSVSLGTGELQITISAVPHATTYRLEIDDNTSFSSPDVTITSDLVNVIAGLAESGTYYARAKALAPSALYADSDYGSFITNSTSVKLAAPTVSAHFVDINTISVTASSLHTDEYQIEISTSSTFSPVDTYTRTMTTNTFTGLTEGTTYYVRVKALSNDVSQYVNSDYSEAVRVTTPATLAAPIITLVPLSTSSFSVQAVSANASSYIVEVSTSDTFTNADTYTTTGALTGYDPGVKYYVRAKAIGDGTRYVDSSYSVTSNVTTLIQITKPTIALTSLGTSDVKLDINELEHVSSYRVEVAKTSTFAQPTVTLTSNLSSTLSGLDEDTDYYVRVKAFSGDAAYTDSEYSTVAHVKTSKQLVAPTTSVEFASTTSITVNAVSDHASSYQIEISLDSEFSSPQVHTETTTSNTYNNLNEGLTYYVRTKALSDDVATYTDSEYSPTVMVTTPITLAVPALVVTPIDHLSFLVQTVSADAPGYVIEVATNSYFNNAETFTAPGVINNRQPATTYYVRAKAVGDTVHNVDSGFTDTATVTTLTKLSAPEITTTVLSNTEVQIDFDAVDDAETYRVEIADNETFTNPMTVLSSRTSIIMPGLAEGTTWYARAKATSSDEAYIDSDYSEVATAYTPVQLDTPVITTGSLNNTELAINITEVDNADRYLLELSTDAAFATIEKITTTELENTIEDRVEGTTYFVRVTAISDDHTQYVDSDVSHIAACTTHLKLYTPTFNVSFIDPTQASLTINAIISSDTFEVQYDTKADFTENPQTFTTTTLVNTISDLTPGVLYYYRVKALTEDTGMYVDSEYSDVGSLLQPIQLDAPTFTVSSYTDTEINLEFEEVENAGGYLIEASTTEEFDNPVSVTSKDTTATIPGLTAYTEYYIRAKALTPSKVYVDSEFSTVATQQTRRKIAAPLIITEVSSDTEVSIFASDVDYADSYSIEISTLDTFADPVIVNIDTLETLISDLQPSTVYYLRARAYDSTGENVTSEYSNIQTAKTLAEPSELPKFDAPVMLRGYADSATQVTFLWTPGTIAPAGYELEIAKDSTFTDKVFGKDISYGYSYYALGELDPNTTYYARIRTIGVAGRGATSNWSNVVSATTGVLLTSKASVAKIIQLDTATETTYSLNATPYIKDLTGIENPNVEVEASLYPDFSVIAASETSDSTRKAHSTDGDSGVDGVMEEWDVQAEEDDLENATKKQITLVGLEPGETYYVRAKVLAEDDEHTDSDYYYAEQMLTTKRLTDVPKASLTLGTDKLIIRVDSSGVNGWSYEVSDDDAFIHSITSGIVDKSQLYKVVENLGPDTKYYVRVKMFAEDDTHVDSNWVVVSGTTYSESTLPKEARLTFGIVDVGTNSVTLTVSDTSDLGAKIEIATDPSFNKVVVTDVTNDTMSLVLDGLQPETTYYLRAKNLGDGNYIKDSDWMTGTSAIVTKPLPKVCDALDVAGTVTNNAINLTWTPVEVPNNGYELQYSKSFDFADAYTSVIHKSLSSKSITGLDPQTQYYLRMRVKGVPGTSGDSDWKALSLKTEEALLPKTDKPKADDIVTGPDFVTISWSPIEGAVNGYEVEWATNPVYENSKHLTTMETHATLTGITPSTTYYARVRALGVDGVSDPSDWVELTITTPTLKKFNAPEVDGQLSGTNTVLLIWTAAASAPAYTVEVDTNESFTTATRKVLAENGLVMSNLMEGTTYYARVRVNSTDDMVASEWSNTFSITTGVTPVTPSFKSVVLSEPQVNGTVADIEWSQGEARNYEVQYTKGSDFSGDYATATVTNKETLRMSNLSENETYTIRVRVKADSSHEPSPWVQTAFTTTTVADNPDQPKLETPQILSNEATDESISFSWIASTNEFCNGYIVEIGGGDLTSQQQTVLDTQFEFRNLKPATTYTLSVKAKGVVGKTLTSDAATVSVSTKAVTPLATPTITSAVAGLTTANFAWAADSSATGYTLQIAENAEFTKDVITVLDKANTSTALATGLKEGTPYYYRLKSSNQKSQSDYAKGSFVTKTTISPLAITDVTPDVETCFVEWNKVKGVTEYTLELSQDGDFKDNVTKVVNRESVNSKFISGLEPLTTYYIRLSAAGQDSVVQSFSTLDVSPLKPARAPVLTVQPIFGGVSLKTDLASNSYIRYEVSESDKFGKDTITDTVQSNGWIDITGLKNNKKYYIRVKSLGQPKETTSSNWASQSFITSNKYSTKLTGKVTTDQTLAMEWEEIEGAEHYIVQLLSDKKELIFEQYTPYLEAESGVLDKGTYYFTVQPSSTEENDKDHLGLTFTSEKFLIAPGSKAALANLPVDIDTNGDGRPDLNIDKDKDGIPDLNIDVDGDGVPDLNIDTDGDGKPNLNIDLDGDGEPDINIDLNGDKTPDKNRSTGNLATSDINIDWNNDGKPDLNIDTNKDKRPDVNIDTDGDGVADINIDTNGDGKADLNIDINGDMIADVNIDTNGDGKPDKNVDTTGDGKSNLNTTTGINIDTNGDGKPNLNVDLNGDGVPDMNIDTNGDGIADANIDTNGDGKPDYNMIPVKHDYSKLNLDIDYDGKPDLNIDTNNDGKPDVNIDVDRDGKPDLNIDTNGDGKADLNIDTNGDNKPDLNIDTNGDGIADINIDTNGDGKPDLNIDVDGDGKPDLNIDTNGDGIPDLNIDSDGDGKADTNVDTNGDGKPDLNIKSSTSKYLLHVDTDGDGKPDLNIDTNGDGIPDLNIDTDGDGKADLNIDTNGDGKPDLNIDTNGDGKADLNIDTNGDGKPDLNIDTNGDGIADLNIDTDGDGKPDKNLDLDGDGKIDDIAKDDDDDIKDEDKGTLIEETTYRDNFAIGMTYQIKGSPKRNLKYEVEEGTVKVTKTGLVTFKNAGESVVRVTDADTGETDLMKFYISKGTPTVDVPLDTDNDGSVSINVGEHIMLFRNLNHDGDVKIEVSDNTVLQVTQDGNATGLKAGRVTIKFTFAETTNFNGITKEIEVIVIEVKNNKEQTALNNHKENEDGNAEIADDDDLPDDVTPTHNTPSSGGNVQPDGDYNPPTGASLPLAGLGLAGIIAFFTRRKKNK